MEIAKVTGVVLAGAGSVHDKGVPDEGPNKAGVRIGDRTMVEYVLTVLQECPEVDRVVLVAPESLWKEIPEAKGLSFASPGGSPLESFARGLEVLDRQGLPASWILACTGDIPFLTREAVSDFITRCRGREADLYYPIIPRRAAEERFPGVQRTYARLREGCFTGGNLFLVRREIVDRCLAGAEEFVRLRKQPLALARLVGLGLLIKYLLGVLTLAEAERRISRLFNIRGAAIITTHAEIGVDVDKPSDLELARRILAGQERG